MAIKSMAQNVKGVRNLVFAQADLSANDFDEIQVIDLPTLYFYPTVRKSNPIKFEGITSSDNIVNFLKRYVT